MNEQVKLYLFNQIISFFLIIIYIDRLKIINNYGTIVNYLGIWVYLKPWSFCFYRLSH